MCQLRTGTIILVTSKCVKEHVFCTYGSEFCSYAGRISATGISTCFSNASLQKKTLCMYDSDQKVKRHHVFTVSV